MTVNLELLNKTLDIIKVKPEEYDQNTWVSKDEDSPCGTTMCFAGHAAILAGAEIPDPKKHIVQDWYVKLSDNSYLNYQDTSAVNYNEYTHVQFFAQKALGITSEEQDWLFHSDRTVEEIERAVAELNEYGQIVNMGWYDDDDYDDYDDYYDDEPCDCGCNDY